MPMRHLAVAVAILGLSALLAAAALCRDPTLVVGQERADQPAPPLEHGRLLSQTFVAPIDGLAYVELYLATYAASPEGRLHVELRPAEDETLTLAEWWLPASEIDDNAWRRFAVPQPLSWVGGETLVLLLGRDMLDGRALTVWTGTADPYPDGALRVDGVETGDDMAFRVGYERPCADAALARLAETGYAPAVAGALLVGLFALPMAFLYTYGRLALSDR